MAKRQGTEPRIEPKEFSSVGEIDQAIAKLRRRISDVTELRSKRSQHDGPEVDPIVSNIRNSILEVFGPNSPEYRDHQYHEIWSGGGISINPSRQYLQTRFEEGFPHTLEMLEGLIKSLDEKKLDFGGNEVLKLAEKKGPIFIGHGRSREWLALQTFLQNTLHLQCVEFNTESAAGVGTPERLSELLDQASFAFLVMTAEDEQADGSRRARENVVHEAGLFQGRLTFRRAIVVVEQGCTEFSNIQGLGQIRFPKGSIESSFEEVRRVLEREKIVRPH